MNNNSNVESRLAACGEAKLSELEATVAQLIEDDNLDTLVTEDGIRIGDKFFWCDHDYLGKYYQSTWEKASQGEEDDDLDDQACTIQDVLTAHAEYQGAELRMMMRELPEAVQTAIAAYWENKRQNGGFARYDTLGEFAKVFNPLADELYAQRRLAYGSHEFNQLQSVCIDLFEYGDVKWPGKVYESGVYGL